ncbi:MAG: chromosomal replication initiator protein DnaA [Verrucomicrobiota bacterium]|nr:chromosomal replication initiator protein DnaA [Verrucomicrobiota bacterium]
MNKASAADIWHKARKHLRGLLHPDVYSRWIAVIDPVETAGNRLTLAVDNDFYQSWLEENYLPLIRDALAAVTGAQFQIGFTIRPRAAEATQPAKARPPARERPAKRALPGLNPKFTFDEFIVGPANSFAHAAALAVAQAPAKAYNPLFIYGGVGLGKTHIMQAIGHHVLSTSRAAVCYLSSEALLNDYIEALQRQSIVQFRRKYRNAGLLLIDDIHFLAGKERIQEEFFHTFNALFDAHKQIVMTSDRPASEICGLEQRLVSRFEWGLVTELETPDLETRIAILRHKQKQMSLTLPDSVLEWIGQNVRSNIRRLEGALVRVVSYVSLTGREISTDSLKMLLRDTLATEQNLHISLDAIQKAVAKHFDVRLADMTSKRRPRVVTVPRQVAMFLCRRITRSSLPEIANAFGKTHATVLHACRQVKSRMHDDAALRRTVDEISAKLGIDAK